MKDELTSKSRPHFHFNGSLRKCFFREGKTFQNLVCFMSLGHGFCGQIIRILPQCLLCMWASILLVIDYGQDYPLSLFPINMKTTVIVSRIFFVWISLSSSHWDHIAFVWHCILYFSLSPCCICLTLNIVFLYVTVLFDIEHSGHFRSNLLVDFFSFFHPLFAQAGRLEN